MDVVSENEEPPMKRRKIDLPNRTSSPQSRDDDKLDDLLRKKAEAVDERENFCMRRRREVDSSLDSITPLLTHEIASC
jgi:hypothetical protein